MWRSRPPPAADRHHAYVRSESRRAVVISQNVERPLVILPNGDMEPLPEGLGDDTEIQAHYGVDEVVRPSVDFGAAVCIDGPFAGTHAYAARTVGCVVTLGDGVRYGVVDPSAEVMALRHLD